MKLYPIAIVLCSLLFFSNCQNTSQEQSGQEPAATQVDSSKIIAQDQGLVYSVPTPLQVASVIKNENIGYKKELLEPMNRLIDPANNFSKALNLGIYNVDLAYATYFDQQQQAIGFLTNAAKIADQLGVMRSYEASLINKFKDNIKNMDTLTRIIITSYKNTYDYLNEDKRKDVAMLIFTGCFLEGAHLATNLAIQTKSKSLANSVGEQGLYLGNLITLLGDYNKNSSEMSSLITDLNGLNESYKAIEIVYSDSNNDGIKEIDKIMVNDENLAKLAEKIAAIRNKIVIKA